MKNYTDFFKILEILLEFLGIIINGMTRSITFKLCNRDIIPFLHRKAEEIEREERG